MANYRFLKDIDYGCVANRARGAFGGSGGYATFSGDSSSRTDMYNDKDSDMIHLFGDNHDATLPIVFTHISRTAGELDPSDLTSTGPKVPWLRTVSKASMKRPIKNQGISITVHWLAQYEECILTCEIVKDEPSSEEQSISDIKMDTDDEQQENALDISRLPPVMMDADAPAQYLFALDENVSMMCYLYRL